MTHIGGEEWKSTTSGEEGADHEAEADGRHRVHEQEDEDQRGVAVRQHRSVWAHLKKQNDKHSKGDFFSPCRDQNLCQSLFFKSDKESPW